MVTTSSHSPTGHARATLPANASSKSGVRNAALDFTKGGLVLCMIAYHTINYFRYDPNLLRHLHFLPPSFIFIVGFLITHIYRSKIATENTAVIRRLFIRGLKTFALFIGLNLVVQSLVRTSYNRNLGIEHFLSHLDVVLLTGEQRAAVFGVLLPISYVLFLSAPLLRLTLAARYTIHVFAVIVIALCVVLERRGLLVFNLDLVSMGLAGAAAGFITRERLDRIAQHVGIIALAYLAYSVAVRFQYPSYLMNTVGVTLSLLLLYGIGLRISGRGLVAENITLLGNYSLLSYLVQIAVLQGLFRLSRHLGIFDGAIVLPMIVTLFLTLGLIKAVHVVRAHTSLADRAYRAVFV